MFKLKKAFTLVELLVVISIIALLLAILMPSLAKAREQARVVVCASGLKQQGVAMGVYAAGHRKYPAGLFPGFWPHGEMNYPLASSPATMDSNTKFFGQGALLKDKCLDDPRFLYCPSAKNETAFTFKSIFLPYHPGYPNSSVPSYLSLYVGYPYWVAYVAAGSEYPFNNPHNIQNYVAKDIMSGSDKVIISDLTISRYAQPPAKFSKMPIPWSNHIVGGALTGGNVLYNDTSVRWTKMSTMEKDYASHIRFMYPRTQRWLFWF